MGRVRFRDRGEEQMQFSRGPLLVSLALVAALLILELSPAISRVEATSDLAESGVMAISTLADVAILGSGDAGISLVIEVAAGPLADMYRRLLGAPPNATTGEEKPNPRDKTANGGNTPIR